MTQTLLEMDQHGELTGDAAYIFMKSKPGEELYDLETDPDEVHNLVNDPKHQTKLIELRKALADWQLEVGDMGFIPEHDMVNMMWPGLIQPTTANVFFRDMRSNTVLLECQTEGASIAYQQGVQVGSDHWSLYSQPISVKKGEKIVARAVRLGYRTSEITKLER